MAEAATRRELLEKAWDEAEAKDTPEDEKEEVKGAPETEEQVEKPEESTEKEAPESTDEKPEDAYSREKTAAKDREQEPVRRDSPTDRAPGSWKPAQREKWAALPADVRAEINRRETQIQQTLSQTDNVRRFANDFATVVNPYGHLLKQFNTTPLQAVETLMATNARLITGSQEDKARTVAEIIGKYGIDVKVLDQELSKVYKDGKVQAPNGAQDSPPGWARPMFEFMSTVQQQRQMYEQREQQRVAQEIERVAEKPFFEDLREEMADIMEVSANRGRTLTLDQAYEKAVALNPEIAGILAQRKKAQNPVSAAAATLARARRAASTVSGSPSGSKVDGKPTPKSRREMIEQAWDDAENS